MTTEKHSVWYEISETEVRLHSAVRWLPFEIWDHMERALKYDGVNNSVWMGVYVTEVPQGHEILDAAGVVGYIHEKNKFYNFFTDPVKLGEANW